MFNRAQLLAFTVAALLVPGFTAPAAAQQSAPVAAAPQIQSFNSDITVNPDSTLLVRETITVLTTSAAAQHGLYRDVLTQYSDRFLNPYVIHIEVVSLERDDQPAEFYLRRIAHGLRIYLSKSGEALPPGQHTYELTYAVDRAIGFFPDHDELYWNVTGDGWIFPVQAVTAVAHLPKGIVQQAIISDAYTGRQESAGTAYTASADNQSNATFRTTRALDPHESLTIVVRWPKGFVSPPTDDQEHRYFLEDNQALINGVLGLAVLLAYCAAAWFLAQRARHRGEIRPRSEPPAGYSPAALRYLWRKAFDQKAVITNLLDLSLERVVAILEDISGSYVLGSLKPDPLPAGSAPRTGDPAKTRIPADEKLLRDRLFAHGDTVQLVPTYHGLLGSAVEALHLHLRVKMQKLQWMNNARYIIPALVIALAAVARTGFLIQGGQPILICFLAAGLLLWSMGLLAALMLAIDLWRYALARPLYAPTVRKQVVIVSLVGLLFVLGEVLGMAALVWAGSPEVMGVFAAAILLLYVFHLLFRGKTGSDRALKDEIEGFRLFLASAEQVRRDPRTPATFTSHLFERLLPYAMALNAEKVWNERFAAALAERAPGEPVEYSPFWYSGPAWDRIFPAAFATSLGNSFFNALTSSLSPPASRKKSVRSRP